VARFILEFSRAPRAGEVYNLGGGKENSCSILEAFELTQRFTGQEQKHVYLEENRSGDHICYYSDLRKMRAHYPKWDITKPLQETIREIVASWRERQQV
jgi:CDP-paratose 2-epimerase